MKLMRVEMWRRIILRPEAIGNLVCGCFRAKAACSSFEECTVYAFHMHASCVMSLMALEINLVTRFSVKNW